MKRPATRARERCFRMHLAAAKSDNHRRRIARFTFSRQQRCIAAE
jgi:hypothetical protein